MDRGGLSVLTALRVGLARTGACSSAEFSRRGKLTRDRRAGTLDMGKALATMALILVAPGSPDSPPRNVSWRGAAAPGRLEGIEGTRNGGDSGTGDPHARRNPQAPVLPLERSRFTMGTIAMVRIEALEALEGVDQGAEGATNESVGAAAQAALDAIDEVDRAASLYRPESDLNRINANAFRRDVRAGPIVAELLAESLRLARLTRGAFDPSIKPLMDHLGFYRELGSEPDPGGLPGALRRVGWRKVILDPRTGTVRFCRPGMALDFGGIGKGYALDRAGAALKRHGILGAKVELGRSHLLMGRGENGAGLFRLGVAAPDETGQEAVRAVIRVPAGSVATSSPLAQARNVNGRLVGHIVDPRRGPLDTPVLAATVWASTGSEADALAKAIVVSGPRSLKPLGRRFRFEALIYLATSPGDPVTPAERGASLGRRGKKNRPANVASTGGHERRYRAVATPGLIWEDVENGR